MTVYSKKFDQKVKTVRWQAAVLHPLLFKLNIIMLLIAFGLLLFHIIISNSLTSKRYGLDILRAETARINNIFDLLKNNLEADFEIKSLISYAQEAGFVEDKNLNSIIDTPEITLSRISN